MLWSVRLRCIPSRHRAKIPTACGYKWTSLPASSEYAHIKIGIMACCPYTYCISSNDSARVLSYQLLPTSIQCGGAMARRRKEERRVGIASRGMVRRWGRFASRVRHRVVPDRERVPARCNASGSAVDVCRDAPARAQRAERAADGGVVDVSRALSVSPRAPRINAQRGARFGPYHTRNCLSPKKLRREIQ